MQASDKLEALEFWFPTPPVFNYQAMQTQKKFSITFACKITFSPFKNTLLLIRFELEMQITALYIKWGPNMEIFQYFSQFHNYAISNSNWAV